MRAIHKKLTVFSVPAHLLLFQNAQLLLPYVLGGDEILAGGIVYDAIILKAAQKAKVEKILTLNANDFYRLCPEAKEFIATP